MHTHLKKATRIRTARMIIRMQVSQNNMLNTTLIRMTTPTLTATLKIILTAKTIHILIAMPTIQMRTQKTMLMLTVQ